MKKKTLVVGLVGLGLVALVIMVAIYSFRGNSAIKYSDQITSHHDRIVEKINLFMAAFDPVPRDPALAESRLNELQSQIAESLEQLGELPDYEGDTQYRISAVKLVEFYKSIARKEYREVMDILGTSEITQDAGNRLDFIDKDVEKRENVLFEKLRQTQLEFAEKNNFRIEK
ncbi:MAG: hypothetical protein GY765_14225 [bacterium]|nr:hypothetical protein [bacterium]